MTTPRFLAGQEREVRRMAFAAYRALRVDNAALRFDREQLRLETELACWLALESFDPSRGVRLSTHVYTTVRRMVMDEMRRQAPGLRQGKQLGWISLDPESLEWLEAQADPADVEAETVSRLGAEQIAPALLARVSARRREAVWRCLALGETQDEAAAAMGVSATRVSQLLHDGCKAIRRAVDARRGGIAEVLG